MTSPRIIAVVPAYNEAKTIAKVVSTLRPHISKVIVIDDCSTDGTGDIARDAGATVIWHSENKGYDASLNDGFKAAADDAADIIFTFDADGEHDSSNLQRVLGPIVSDVADIVIGQRPENRHWSEVIFSLYTRTHFGIQDPLCGFKAYRRRVYDAVGFFDSRQSIGTELMIRGIQHGFRLACVPITLNTRADASRFYALNLQGNLKILRGMLRVMLVK